MCKTFSTLSFILELQSLYIKNKWKVLTHNTFHLNYLEIIFAIIPQQRPAPLPMSVEYQYITSSSGNIWETF